MIRAFAGVQTISGTAQPVFGTALTAASKTPAQPTAGNTPPATAPAQTLAVTSTSGFRVDDRVLVGPTANFTYVNAYLLDQGTVVGIVDATHLKVVGLTQNHAASGEWVVLNEVASFVSVVPVAAAAFMYLGTDSTVAANDPQVFDVIGKLGGTAVEPTYWSVSPTTGKADSYQTMQYWINGTAADTFVARFHQN